MNYKTIILNKESSEDKKQKIFNLLKNGKLKIRYVYNDIKINKSIINYVYKYV